VTLLTATPRKSTARGALTRAAVAVLALAAGLAFTPTIAWRAVACGAVAVAYGLVVLGPDLERVIAVGVIIAGLTILPVGLFWAVKIQPVTDDLGRKVDTLTTVVDKAASAGDTLGRAVDQAKTAIGGKP
jgi:hypothetical protein